MVNYSPEGHRTTQSRCKQTRWFTNYSLALQDEDVYTLGTTQWIYIVEFNTRPICGNKLMLLRLSSAPIEYHSLTEKFIIQTSQAPLAHSQFSTRSFSRSSLVRISITNTQLLTPTKPEPPIHFQLWIHSHRLRSSSCFLHDYRPAPGFNTTKINYSCMGEEMWLEISTRVEIEGNRFNKVS